MPQPPDDGRTRPTGEHPEHPDREPSAPDQHTPVPGADPGTDAVDRTPDDERAPPTADDPRSGAADTAVHDQARTPDARTPDARTPDASAGQGTDGEEAPPAEPTAHVPAEPAAQVPAEPAAQVPAEPATDGAEPASVAHPEPTPGAEPTPDTGRAVDPQPTPDTGAIPAPTAGWAPLPPHDSGAPTEQLPVAHDQPAHRPGDLPFVPTQLVTPAPGTDHPADWPAAAPAESRRRMWVTVALVLAVLLCGGGGVSAYLLLRNAESTDGAPDPATAVNRFLTAVYTDQNADRAAELVCRESRDTEKLGRKVDEVRSAATTYTGPKFTWSPPTIARERKEHAVVNVKLTMTTQDEKIADQQLTFTTVRKTGWWVCEVSG